MIDSGESYSDERFERADARAADIESAEFQGCEFARCAFNQSTLRACVFDECVFTDCDLSLVRIPHCSFSRIRFEGCKILGVNWTEASWKSPRLWYPVAFRRCALDHSTFLGVDISGVSLVDCEAREVDFREADLSGVDLSGTDLSGAVFMGTKLNGADLRAATNYHIDPARNALKGAKFSLPDAMSLLAALDVEIDGWG